MQGRVAATLGMLTLTIGLPASAQDDGPPEKERVPTASSCAGSRGEEMARCMERVRIAQTNAKIKASGAIGTKDGKVFNDASTAANLKLQARDFAGAVAVYQAAIDANPTSPVLHRLYAGKAIALRQQGVAAFNGGTQPTYPPAGATNDQIRAANAANAALEQQKRAAALPILREAQVAAGRAAALAAAPANKDRGVDDAIAIELRQDASLLYRLDHDAVLATPRASADLEAAALRKWLADNPALAEPLVAQFGIATAAAVVAKDPAGGLALADEVMARAGGDPDAAIGYADLVAAKAPAGDPRRAKAAAGLARVEAGVTDTARSNRLKALKTKLAS